MREVAGDELSHSSTSSLPHWRFDEVERISYQTACGSILIGVRRIEIPNAQITHCWRNLALGKVVVRTSGNRRSPQPPGRGLCLGQLLPDGSRYVNERTSGLWGRL